MFRYFFLIIFIVVSISQLHAQNDKKFEKPDYVSIERITKDKKLQTWYPKLFARYEKNDTTLKDRDFVLLYYGYFFQVGYRPSAIASVYNDSLESLAGKPEDLNDDEKRKMIRFTKILLKKQPFDLENINRLCNAYQLIGYNDSLNLYLYKLKMIARTMCTTGDGITENDAIHVLSVYDEYSLIHLLGYDFDGSRTQTPKHNDYLKVKKNEDGITGFYFDVSEILKSKKLKVKN